MRILDRNIAFSLIGFVAGSLFGAETRAAYAAEPEFLITSDKVVSLRHPEVTLNPGAIFDKAKLSTGLPGYQFELGHGLPRLSGPASI